MIRWSFAGSLFVCAAGLAMGQAAEPAAAFQVADVHASAKVTNPYMRGGVMRGGRFEVRYGSLLDLISLAYDIDYKKVVGGPAWLATDRFDIVAGAAQATTQEQARLMLQGLLAERFGLAIKKETRPMPAFVLSAGKGKAKLKESDGKDAMGCRGVPQADAAPNTGAFTVVMCSNMTMAGLAASLQDMAAVYLRDAVIDETGLKGAYEFQLKFNQRNQLAAAGSEGLSIFDAVDRQLGLKLEPQTRPQAVLVVDTLNRNPTPNAPGIVSKLPPAPPSEFDVAIIKRSGPEGRQAGTVQGGRVDLAGWTLKQLIQTAWDINNDDLMAGLPKYGDSNKFDVTAKAPIPEGATDATEVDEIALLQMLRTLLEDRFKLKSHMEERPVEGYVLSAAKPKLEKAAPGNRTECVEGPGKDGKDPRNTTPILNRLMTCTNMTMGQFAELLPVRVNGYVRTAVQDSTGLDGPYDFTISFSGTNLYRNNTPDSPNGALSFPDAVNKQLGLKLELQKRPMQVLVIDHVEEDPTEN